MQEDLRLDINQLIYQIGLPQSTSRRSEKVFFHFDLCRACECGEESNTAQETAGLAGGSVGK
jgi:hypothetical protein